MELTQYLDSDTVVGSFIVKALIVASLAWVVALIYRAIMLKRQQADMARCSELKILSKFLTQQAEERSKSTDAASPNLATEAEADSVFQKFCLDRSIKSASPVAQHIKAIFDAGWKETRLDAGELIKHTAGDLFRVNNLLRSVLAVFIVGGLLGTLFGLAASLAHLAPLTPSGTAQSSAELSRGLSVLLVSLKSAFAPSIWGIILTIVGVFIFSFYIYFIASPVKATLENLTLTVWVPQLFATTSLRRKFEAAERVAKFAEDIERQAAELKRNLEMANGPLELLAQTSIKLGSYSDKFVEGVGGLLSFQQELQNLYRQMLHDSSVFNSNLQQSTKTATEFQQRVLERLRDQGEKIKHTLHALNVYEEAYVEGRKEIDLRLREVLVEARKAYSSIIDKNRDLIKEVSDPLREDLSKGLKGVSLTLGAELGSIQQKFADFDIPITAAAGMIGGALTTVVERTEALNNEFHKEFTQQTEANRSQLTLLKEANEKVGSLVEQMKSAVDSQGRQVGEFTDTVGALSRNVAVLGDNVSTLSQSVSLNGSIGLSSGRSDEEANEQSLSLFHLAALLVRMAKTDERQDDQVQTLIKEISELRREIGTIQIQKAQTEPPPPAISQSNPTLKEDEDPGQKLGGDDSKQKKFLSGFWK